MVFTPYLIAEIERQCEIENPYFLFGWQSCTNIELKFHVVLLTKLCTIWNEILKSL